MKNMLYEDSDDSADLLARPWPQPQVLPANFQFELPALYLDTVSDFVEKLAELDEQDSSSCGRHIECLKETFSHAAARLGFKHATYHLVKFHAAGSITGRLPYFISDYPPSWVSHYIKEGYMEEDPVIAEFLRRRTPFHWAEIGRSEQLTSRQRRLFDEARDAGIVGGMTVPIHTRGAIAAVSLIPDGADTVAAMDARSYQRLLSLMAFHYHAVAHRRLLERSLAGHSTRRRTLLSPRERQVLEWAAQGKSNWEVASILNISCKSVEFHVEGAKRKLQVFNRTHAVAKAIVLGLLSVN
jgi:DNA-binding CsgD family transcriptional regulator